MLAEKVAEWRKQWKDEGREVEFEAMVVEWLLIVRFGPLTPAARARLAQATMEQLDDWTERVLDAPSLESVFDDVPPVA